MIANQTTVAPAQLAAPAQTAAPAPTDTHTWHGHVADDLGATDGPEPMATLTVTNGKLQLASVRGSFVIARELVQKIGRGKLYPWFFSSIQIHHRSTGIPAELQFKPMGIKPAELLRQLRETGFPVA